jgi:hypothetical protein
MGQRLIITEEEKKTILSLYEQTDEEYKKENDFLKRYVGKTVIWYRSDMQSIDPDHTPSKIESITYDGNAIYIKGEYNVISKHKYEYFLYEFPCLHNPDRIGYDSYPIHTEGYKGFIGFNNKLIDNINQQGFSAGIKWCKKPKADFGIKQSVSATDKMVQV